MDRAWGSILLPHPPHELPCDPGPAATLSGHPDSIPNHGPAWWPRAGGLSARGGGGRQAAGPAWPCSRGAERVKVCAGPAGGAAGGGAAWWEV